MTEKYALLFHLYRLPVIRAVRILILFFTVIIIFADLQAGLFPNLSLFFLIWFSIIEIFFHFKIARVKPDKPVSAVPEASPQQAFTFPLLEYYIAHQGTKEFIQQLARRQSVKVLLEKAALTPDDLTEFSVTKEALGMEAVGLVKSLKGTYVTTVDMMAVYLLLTEEKTKLLFSKKIKPEELKELLFWIRNTQKEEQYPYKIRVKVYGGGFGEALTTGWTPETEKYTDNFTYRALKSNSLITGREKDFTTMMQSLSKTTDNNVMIVGDMGSGKENLVRFLAKKSFEGDVGGTLDNKVIYELMIGPLIAGTSDRGLLEERLQAIIAEVAHSGNVFLYIPEFQNILGSGAYNIDLSGALLPYLKAGATPIIATITPGNYKTYMEKSPLREVFTTVQLSEPDQATTLRMILDKIAESEKTYRVLFSYQTVKEAIKHAKRYLQDDVLPGSAITLLEDSANSVALTKRDTFGRTGRKMVLPEDIIKTVEDRSHVAVSAPEGKEKELLLHLEENLHKKVIGQHHAITVIAEAMRRLRTGLNSTTKPVSFLFLGPTGVGKTETARALSGLYFGGEASIIRLDMSEYSDESGLRRLLGSLPGEGSERGELTDKIHDHPSSLILLDEFEKAHPSIRDLFLQVLEDGRLTDNKGKTVSFVNSVIIATSNAGSEFIREHVRKGGAIDTSFHQALLNDLQGKGIFKPELLNRFDDVVTFLPLTPDETQEITKLLVQGIIEKLADEDITLMIDEGALRKIAADGYDKEYGARPIRRYLQNTVEDILAQKKLTGEIQRGDSITVSIAQDGSFVVTKTQ